MIKLIRRRRHDEAGMTVTEVIVATAILGVLSAALMAGVASMSTAAKSTQDRSDTVNQVRVAIERISRDLRAANPIDVYATPADYLTQLSFTVYCANAGVDSCPANNQRAMLYRLDNHRLERSINGGPMELVIGSEGGSTYPIEKQRLSVLNAGTESVFKYFKEDATAIDPAANDGTKFRDCTRTIEINLKVVAEAGATSRPVNQLTRVTLRNFHEVTGC